MPVADAVVAVAAVAVVFVVPFAAVAAPGFGEGLDGSAVASDSDSSGQVRHLTDRIRQDPNWMDILLHNCLVRSLSAQVRPIAAAVVAAAVATAESAGHQIDHQALRGTSKRTHFRPAMRRQSFACGPVIPFPGAGIRVPFRDSDWGRED